MNNTQKYVNLADYSVALSESIKNISKVAFYSKPSKQLGSLNVTLENLKGLIHNIGETIKLKDKMKMLTVIDPVAKKDNKSAKKASDILHSVNTEINQNLSKLKEEYFKQLELARKQCYEVAKTIKDKKEHDRFIEATTELRLMAQEAKTNKNTIPFTKSDPLAKFRQTEAKREHKEKESQLERISDFNLEDANKLEEALKSLEAILDTNYPDKLRRDVKKEVAQIKRALPPKTITITKEGLEQIHRSSQLILDLEQINEVMKTASSYLGSNGKMRKVNRQLDSLKPLLESAIKEEKEREQKAKKQYQDIQSKVKYATEAVKTYGNILDGNARLGQEQIRIGNKTHPLYAENDRLKEQERKAIEDAKEIEAKPVDRRVLGDDKIVDELYEQARNNRETIRQNEEYMKGKSEEVVVTQLPPEYTDMKKRLQSVSSLYHPTIENGERMIR